MNEEITQKNKRLLEVHNYWYKNIAEPVIEKYADVKFSLPFYVGLSNMNTTKMPVAMIVGQETRDHGELNEVNQKEWPPHKSQEWSISYLNTQLNLEDSHYGNKCNGSPFWKFFRSIYGNGVFPCWSNIDKFHRYIINGKDANNNNTYKTERLKEEHKVEFNQIIHPQKKTLLLEEIEIIKPDVLIFVTGPDYIVSMETALMCNLSSQVPDLKNDYVRDITKVINIGIPAFWTYHPLFLNLRKIMSDCIKQLICRIF